MSSDFDDTLGYLAAAVKGHVSLNDMVNTHTGREYLMMEVVKRLTKVALAQRSAESTMRRFPISAMPNDAAIIDKFLAGTKYRPGNGHSVFEASVVCRVAACYMSLIKLGGKASFYSGFLAMENLLPFVRAHFIRDERSMRDISLNRVVRKREGPVAPRTFDNECGVFDGFRNFTIRDAVNCLNTLVGERRKLLVVMPYSDSLFEIARDQLEHPGGHHEVQLECGFSCIFQDCNMFFLSNHHTEQFVVPVKNYVEVMTRCYLPITTECDIQIEVDSHYPGVIVLRLQEVLKQYRFSAETWIRNSDKLPGLTAHQRAVFGYAIENRKFVRTKYYVSENDYSRLYKFGMASDKLDIAAILSYANAIFESHVGTGPVVRAGTVYPTETLVAIVQSAYIECFRKRYDMTQLLAVVSKADVDSLVDRYGSSVLVSLGIVIAVAGTIGLTSVSTLPPMFLTLAKPVLAGSMFSKAFDKAIRLAIEWLNRTAGEIILPSSYVLGGSQEYRSLLLEIIPLPLQPSLLPFTNTFELEFMFSDTELVKVSDGSFYIRVNEGDVFDGDGNQYVYFNGLPGRNNKIDDKILHSLTKRPGITYQTGDVYSSSLQYNNLKGFVGVCSMSQVGSVEAYHRIYSCDGSFTWIHGALPEFGKVMKIREIAGGKFSHTSPITVLPKDLGAKIHPSDKIFVIVEGDAGIIAPVKLNNAFINDRLREILKFDEWIYTGHYIKAGKVYYAPYLRRLLLYEQDISDTERAITELGEDYVLNIVNNPSDLGFEIDVGPLLEWMYIHFRNKYVFRVDKTSSKLKLQIRPVKSPDEISVDDTQDL